MTVLALTSAKGAPGVSVTALALTLVWPRPVLLVECDPAGGDLLAGYLAGVDPPGDALLGLALAARRGTLRGTEVLERSLSLDATGTRRALAAPADGGQMRPVADAADRLADLICALGAEGSGPDVILDLGRYRESTVRAWSRRADLLLLVLCPTLRGASAARSRVAALQSVATGSAGMGLLLLGDGPYGAREIGEALAVPVVGSVAHDVATAAVLCGERSAGRDFGRSPLMRTARSLSHTLLARMATNPGPQESLAGLAPDPPVAALDSVTGRTA
ncbi:MAG: hypothetical protein ACYDAQ_00595 [Mycobacteriales bacterium]